MTEVVESIADLRKRLQPSRQKERSIGFVPTMGALHAGHRRLLAEARKESQVVVASIFVNPLQFDRKDDLERYPRTMSEDLAMCREESVDYVFAPSPAEMYPHQQLAWVDVPALGEHLCGAQRPGHFRGVATVVLKLFEIVQPDRAYFGEKDAQQLAIIRRMVEDLSVPVAIVPVETVREADGLALSSRNRHLSREERLLAPLLSQALFAARDGVMQGEKSAAAIVAPAERLLASHPEIRVEYFSITDPKTLAPVEKIAGPVLIAAAIWLGSTRLIDNVTVR